MRSCGGSCRGMCGERRGRTRVDGHRCKTQSAIAAPQLNFMPTSLCHSIGPRGDLWCTEGRLRDEPSSFGSAGSPRADTGHQLVAASVSGSAAAGFSESVKALCIGRCRRDRRVRLGRRLTRRDTRHFSSVEVTRLARAIRQRDSIGAGASTRNVSDRKHRALTTQFREF